MPRKPVGDAAGQIWRAARQAVTYSRRGETNLPAPFRSPLGRPRNRHEELQLVGQRFSLAKRMEK
jgi:hypothetical protein